MNERSLRRIRSVGLLLVTSLAVVACSNSPAADTPQVSTRTSLAATTATAASTPQVTAPTNSASAISQSVVTTPSGETSVSTSSNTSARIGSSQTLSVEAQGQTAEVVVTVHGYKPFTSDNQFEQPEEGTTTVAVDAEICMSFANTVQSEDRWVLVDSNNGRYQPEYSMDGGPKPEYPYFAEKLTAGECLRGYIPFKVGNDAKITTIRYSTENGYTLRWSI